MTLLARALATSQGLISCGTFLFFAASDSATGFEMWASDGTTEGTALLGDLTRGATVRLARRRARRACCCCRPAVAAKRLWHSLLLTWIRRTQDSELSGVECVRGALHFKVGTVEWQSNGTARGTYKAMPLPHGEL